MREPQWSNVKKASGCHAKLMSMPGVLSMHRDNGHVLKCPQNASAMMYDMTREAYVDKCAEDEDCYSLCALIAGIYFIWCVLS